MLEIRGHARGGQGMVTAFEMLAKVFSQLGDFRVQAFPAFGVERSGAPIQAFLRVGKKEILNRSNIYYPHLIVVFDESLLEQVPVFEGMKTSGAVLLNTERSPKDFSETADRIYTVPATRIALDNGLGSRSLPIVNAAIMGALARIFCIDMPLVQQVIRDNVPAKPAANVQAAVSAHERILGADRGNDYLLDMLHATTIEPYAPFKGKEATSHARVEGIEAPYWSEPLSKNKTGHWRVSTPVYADRLPPCTVHCPAGTDVRQFVELAANGEFEEAYRVLYEHNPFPGICGRVCPHFCEQHCNRNTFDEGLNIGAIERYIGDHMREAEAENTVIQHRERIAVVGAGPAGLTAALRLCQRGYEVTVFEALSYAGGMMRTGIPRFRLPDEVLDREIDRIRQQGVRIVLNKKVRVEDLAEEYEAVVAAVGNHLGTSLPLKNQHLFTEGMAFLRHFKLEGNTQGIRRGDEIAIIGGGNTAVDVARTVLRLGAAATIYYRRTMQEMPAIAQEVEEAIAEGVHLEFLAAPLAVEEESDGKIALTLTEMELGAPDASGRRRPIPVNGTAWTVGVDTVVLATGQQSDPFVFGGHPVKRKQGRVRYVSGAAVFCAGDMAWGGTVVEAIASGNEVAAEVDAFLRGRGYHKSVPRVAEVSADDINFSYYLPAVRRRGAILPRRDLFGDFMEVTDGLTTEDIRAESARCLHCGACYRCGNCYNFCPDAAVLVDEAGRIRIDYEYCKGCGICVEECPCSAIEFELTETIS
ncbi:MAG: 2-oxoacid:acceptor oxidoreductase family protein [Saprospiraceae bacterium]|nr:2-oxoacid:acceptor oxidoreductase family protein [Saprospiraceae bacterium]